MPKFTLISEHASGEKTTLEFEKDYLPDVLEYFENFLRGTGFHFTGNLDFVENEYDGQGFAQFDPNQKEWVRT